MAIGAFWFSIMSLFVKLAGKTMPSMEVVMWRGVFTLALSYGAVRRAGLAPLGTQRRLLLTRGLVGCLGLMCFYFSLVHLPLGEATLIQYTNPIWATIVAAMLVGERIGIGEVVCLMSSLVGVALIARPAFLFGGVTSAVASTHVAVALLGAMFSGIAYAIVRKLGAREHRLVIVLYLPLTTVPLSLLFLSSTWHWPTGWEWLVLVAIGVTTQMAQVQLTRGLQLETAARATATGYLQIVFAGLWGALLLDERANGWSVLGAALIVGSTLGLIAAHRAATSRETAAASSPDG
jgi:drug/metabolite transporter (DMT)-like permease